MSLLVASAAMAKPLPEEPDNLLNDRFTLQAGLESSSNSTHVRFDSSNGGLGTDLEGEKDLGLPARKLIGRGELMFRMRSRHRVHVGTYFLPLDRRATAALTQSINFGDSTYIAHEIVESELKMRLLAVNYTYSFVKNERVELGASVGFDIVGFEALAAVPARLRSERQERSAPAPLVGLDGTVRISSRFYGEARVQYLKVKASKIHGTLQSQDIDLLYRLSPNVTFGLGYGGFNIDVDSLKVGDSGRFGLRSTGPQIFARIGF